MNGFRDPKFVIAYTIILGFAAAYISNPSETMNGALIAAFAGAWGFYLGSSSGQSVIREQMGKALDIATSALPPPPTTTITTTTAPASSAPAEVVVVNEPDAPVPTTTEEPRV